MPTDPPQRRSPADRRNAPRIHVEVTRSGVRVPLALARVRTLATLVLQREHIPAASVAIQFVSSRTIARLHRTHMGVAGTTDIVTLEHARGAPGAPHVGEIHIAPEVAAENARRFGVRARDEVARLVVHGVLHAVGYEHPEGEGRTTSPMWQRQEAALRAARRRGVI